MKQPRFIIYSVALLLCAFIAVVYTSCKKSSSTTTTSPNLCAAVICQNTGTCTNGVCTCPTGYSGKNCELSTINFVNHAPTSVKITVNGITDTILQGGSKPLTGTAGSQVIISDTTIDSNTLAPNYVSRNDTVSFPTGGAQFSDSFAVPANYFYFKIIDTSSASVFKIDMYVGLSNETLASSLIVGRVYYIGYYQYIPGMIIGILLSDSSFNTYTPSLSTTATNQVYTITL